MNTAFAAFSTGASIRDVLAELAPFVWKRAFQMDRRYGEDLYREVIMKMVKYLPGLHRSANLLGITLTMLNRAAVNHSRIRKRSSALVDEHAARGDGYLEIEVRDLVAAVLRLLSEQDRRIFQLYFVEGLTAAAAGCTTNVVSHSAKRIRGLFCSKAGREKTRNRARITPPEIANSPER